MLSVNGLAGVVVITGSDINYKTGSTLKIGSMIDSILESVGNLANLTTTDKTSLVNAVNELVTAIGTVNTDITNLGTRISNAEATVGIVQTGATATQNISAGQYVIWNDALYKATSNISSGDTLSGTNLNAVSDGIGNELNSKTAIEALSPTPGTNITFMSNNSFKMGKIVIVNIRFQVTGTINASSEIITGLPEAIGNNLQSTYTMIKGSLFDVNSTNEKKYSFSKNGAVKTTEALANNEEYVISIVYIAENY